MQVWFLLINTVLHYHTYDYIAWHHMDRYQNVSCWTFRLLEFLMIKHFLFNYFLLKDYCFTEFCCFLSNLNMNQPQVYIYPLPFETPSHLPPIPPVQLVTKSLFEFPEPYSKFLLAIYFTYDNVSFHFLKDISQGCFE